MNLTYIVETKDWNNIDSYPTHYKGNSLIIALSHFKEQHLKGEDVVLFIEDENGNTLDTITNYNNDNNNIIHCNDFFLPSDFELKKQHKESIQQKEIYNSQYKEQLHKNETIKKDNERLQRENRELKQQLNKQLENNNNAITVTPIQKENEVYWYEYKLRGFSPFCQPKGHIQHDETKGRWGVIAYNRPLTENELYEYDLKPYQMELKAM